MGEGGTETFTDDAVPGCIVFFVKLLLDKGGDVPLVIVLLEGLDRAVHSILLHLVGHKLVYNHDHPVYNFRKETPFHLSYCLLTASYQNQSSSASLLRGAAMRAGF